MNTNANPAAASAFSPRVNPCYGSDPNVATLNVLADDERSYQLPYAQFLYAEMIPNPALERDANAPPEKLLISFLPKVGWPGDCNVTSDKQLKGIKLQAVRMKRDADQALNTKEFAVLAGVSYSVAREWFHLPGFPAVLGKVFW